MNVFLLYGLGTYAVLLGSWMLACAPFVVIDHFDLLVNRRIQQKAKVASSTRATARRMVLINFAWLLPAVVLAAPLLARCFPFDAVSPSWHLVPLIGALWFVLHDISFYSYHRVLHEVPWLYKTIHKPHHVFTAPFAWSSHAVHPVEMALQSVGAMSGPLLWSSTVGLPLHAWWVWLAVVQWQGVMDHCGYELPKPFDVFALLPGFGGTKFHDEHHQFFLGNYAAALSVIDDVMGTRVCRPNK